MSKVTDQAQRSGSPIRECMPDISISLEESQNLYKSLTSGNLENASRLWKKYGYIFLEPLKPRQNFELIRSITKIRDNTIAQLEAELRLLSRNKYKKILKEKEYEIEILRNTLAQKDTQNPELDELFKASKSTFESEIQGKNNEIKELMKEIETLQYKFNEIEEENRNLKEILTKTSDEIKSRSDGFYFQKNHKIDEELVYLKQICFEYSLKNQYLESELKIIKIKKGEIYDLRDHLLQLLNKAGLGEDEIAKINFNISEIIDYKINEQLEFIQSSMLDSWKTHNESYQNEKIIKEVECLKLNSEIKKLNKLLENEKIINQDIKRMSKEGYESNEWKKIRNESIERIEKAYEDQNLELNKCIKELSDRNSSQIKEISELKDQLNYRIREVAGRLKKEHETKKEIAEHFSKEKSNHEKTKEQLKKLLDNNNEIILKLNEESAKVSEKTQKINELEDEISKSFETIKNLEIKLNEKNYSKQTKLSKKSKEIECNWTTSKPEVYRETKKCSQHVESQARILQEKEEAIENLIEINRRLKNEIVNLDYKIQLKDNIISRFKKNVGIEEVETENFELKRENEEIKEKDRKNIESIEHLKNEIAKLQNELISSEINFKKLKESSAPHTLEDKHLKEYMSRFDDFEKRYSSLINDYENSQKECAKLNEEKAKFQILNSQLIHEKELLYNQIKDFEEKLIKYKAKSYIEKESQTEETNEIKNIMESIKEKFEKWNAEFDIKHQISFSDIRDADAFINLLIEEYKKLRDSEKFSITFQHINDERSQSINISDESLNKPKISPKSCMTAFGSESFSSYTGQKLYSKGSALNQLENPKSGEKNKSSFPPDPEKIQLKAFPAESSKQINVNAKPIFQSKVSNLLSNIPLPNLEESKESSQLQNSIDQTFLKEIPIEDVVKLLKNENSHLSEALKILEEENTNLKNTIKIFREDCDEWKKSLLELYSHVKKNPREKIGDVSPKEAIKKIFDALSGKEDVGETETPKKWSQKEDAYMQTIESLTIEKRYLIKSVEDYEKELQNLRKQLDFYKIASNSQNGGRRKRDSPKRESRLSYSENLSLGSKIKEKLTLEELESQSKYTQELIKEYKQSKPTLQAKLLNHSKYLSNISRSSHQELLQALYEEQNLRQELESELSQKCDLIDELLIELENKRRFIQTREYEFQEILTLKEQEILKIRCKGRY
ncbi:unnamed protein product [Blepharisma stoltei]|uniref:Uncharacterized protein n=1 Tax=Blepharisma stoltei TaxID=1481888 RepID=A0AAU9JIM2_9CILI|nr:unnamed protein product [Blepharisma stoltei]